MSPNLDKVFSLNISPGMGDALTARAARDGVRRADVVRFAVERYLAVQAEPNGIPMGSVEYPTADEIADAVAARLGGVIGPGMPDGWTLACIREGALPGPESEAGTPVAPRRKRRTTIERGD